MADLKTPVAQSSHTLRAAWTGLQGTYRSSLPAKCLEQWTKRAALHRVLEGTVEIFSAGKQLFKSERITDAFILHDDAVGYLERLCGYNLDNGKIEFCCLQPAEDCWPTKDLLVILDRYHAEIDAMFESLLKWGEMSLIAQIRTFTERDRSAA